MKLKFTETVRDKYNNTPYIYGEVYEFEDKRAAEILATGKAVEFIEPKPVEPEEPKGELVNLDELSKKDLVALAKEVGVATRGTKEEIIERLLANAK